MDRVYQVSFDVGVDELNAEYGHLHHAKTLFYLEKARLSYLRDIGFSSEKLISLNLYPVIASVRVRYLREIRNGVISVTCENFEIKERKTLFIHQRALNDKGKLCVEADIESMLLSAGRAVVPPSDFQMAFSSFKSVS